MVFVIHWHESAMDIHVFPIPIPPPTSLSTWSLWVPFVSHQIMSFILFIYVVMKISVCNPWERPVFNPWVGKIPWRRERLPTPVFWPGECHGLYSPQGHKESDTNEGLSLSTLGTEQKGQEDTEPALKRKKNTSSLEPVEEKEEMENIWKVGFWMRTKY